MADLEDRERKFQAACRQMILLDEKLARLQHRYTLADKTNHKSVRYSLRLQLATFHNVRGAFFEYASLQAEVIQELRCELLGDEPMEF